MPPGKSRRPRKAPEAKPVATIAPSGLQAWHCFAFLVVIAVLWHYLRGLLIVVGMVAKIILESELAVSSLSANGLRAGRH
jgi:hypothetical protein